MGFFSRLMGQGISDLPASWKRDPSDDFWYTSTARGQNAAQVRVTVERARKVPVVRDSLAVLAQTIAGLTFGVFRYIAETDRRRVDDHPVMRLFQDPNERDTTYEFVLNMVDDLAAWGFFLGEILERDIRTGTPTKVRRHDPKYVTIEELPDRSLRFTVRKNGLPELTLIESEVWYLPTPPEIDGYMGRSAILDDGEEAIAAIIAMQDYANAFWNNDATPPMIFKYGGKFQDEESKTNFLKAWAQRFGGRNRGRPGVLEHGIEVEQIGQTNEASQFLETRKELQLDIARLWRMPPHKIGILDRATYSNIEQQSLEFVSDTLVPWLRLIERSVAKWLIAPGDDAYFEFNVSSLLRGDTQQRFAAYAQARQWGWISVNEIRAIENMNSIGPAGDRYIEPMNMVEAGSDRSPEAQQQTQQAMRVLHMTVPRVRSTVAGVEKALNAQAPTGRELQIVGGTHA